MTLSEYILEAIASRKTGKYGLFGDEPSLQDLTELLESLGYEMMPAVKGSSTKDYLRAQYIGQNKYFTYRDYYGSEVVVTSENDKENALSFHITIYGLIECVWVLGKSGKGIQGMGFDAKKRHKEFVKTVNDFLGI